MKNLAQCTACGAQLSENSVFCGKCGASVFPKQPAYVYSDALKRNDAVMSTGAFLGSLLLMAIPLAGFILTIVWAAGGTQNRNRQNLARAYLILAAIGLVLSVVLGVLMYRGIMSLPYESFWDMATRA